MRILPKLNLTLLALGLESLALLTLLTNQHIALFWELHILATALATFSVSLPGHRWHDRLLHIGIFIFVPFLGILAFLAGPWVIRFLPARQVIPVFESVPPLLVQMPRTPRDPQIRHGQTGRLILSSRVPDHVRMKALLSLQDMPTRHTSGLLRDSLGDTLDDLRLLAYGMLEQREKALASQLQRQLERYQEAVEQHDEARHAAVARSLAEIYWEMIYQNLALGDMRDYAAEQALHYLNDALRLQVRDAGLWVLNGRLRLMQGDHTGAQGAFMAAIAMGFPRVRVQPYLAELAFLRHDYEKTRQLIADLHQETRMPQMQQIIRFWETAL
ncbi:MAG: hypothetical protein HKM02_08025 [Pseudomonadales bacterium]|nr:hypothetical protein [Pseudomonadales bacterium]